MINTEIARIFRQMAIFDDMLDVPFKPRAYEKAAQFIESLDKDLKEIYEKGGVKDLMELPGIGKGMAEKIEEYIKTKKIKEYEAQKKKIPVDVEGLYAVEGLGPKKIKLLWQKLGIKNLKDLERAGRVDKIAEIPGLGEKTQKNILRGIEFLKTSGNRKLLGYVLPLARKMEERFKKLAGVSEAIVAGSIRRRQETIGDIDLLVATSKPGLAMETFLNMPEVADVYAAGETKTLVRLNNGMDADIRVVPEESFGAALQYFTGSKAHNVELRKIAIAKKMKLNEYGLYKGKKLVAGKTEKEIYEALGLKLMPPEIRAAGGELEAARAGKLPDLIPYGSIKGDLQIQTDWSDGDSSIEEMALAAAEAGLEYIAITDHTKTLAMANGLNEARLARQGKEIDAVNKKFAEGKLGGQYKKFRVLKSAEINILRDGSLDIENETLKKLDIVSAAVHTNFKMPREEMTARMIKAMQNPYLNIIFHPTGRLINRRPPYELDMEQIIRAAKKYNVALELDCFPDRTDLKDEHVRMAISAGVKIVIDSDAHSPEHLKFLELGEATARRGWAGKKDALNTLPVEELIKYFKTK